MRALFYSKVNLDQIFQRLRMSCSFKYNLRFYFIPFVHSSLLTLSKSDDLFPGNHVFNHIINVKSEDDILNNLDKEDVMFWTDLRSNCEGIQESWLTNLRDLLQPINKINLHDIPTDKINIAVHIRKGNGGGQYYDGELASQQIYDFDRNLVNYIYGHKKYSFEWHEYAVKRKFDQFSQFNIKRSVDLVAYWELKFPPEQYYIDQIKFVSDQLQNFPLYVQIFTDDNNPEALVQRISENVAKNNITFHLYNNRTLDFSEQVIEDLYNISRFDILIRSQSYFSRAAELMGNHRAVIFPLECVWLNNKLIVTDVAVKGSIESFINKKDFKGCMD